MESKTVQEPDVRASLSRFLATKKKPWPCHVNRISALDDPCLRKLYYMRHDWKEAASRDDGFQGILETGTVLEPVIERIVSEIGLLATPRWRIVGSQMTTDDSLLKKHEISGSIDGFLQVDIEGHWVTLGVIDIKTMNPNIFRVVNTYEDLARYPWTRRYRGQLMLYSLAHNLARCYLLAVNKTNLYEMKLIPFDVDMAYCEGLLQKALKVNAALEADEAPEGISDPDECPRCGFYAFCHPDISTGGNLDIVDNEELQGVLDRLGVLEEVEKEISSLKKQRDVMLTKGADLVCGGWLIQWKKVDVNYAAKAARKTSHWRKTITRMAEGAR